jgi:hypothetical protein
VVVDVILVVVGISGIGMKIILVSGLTRDTTTHLSVFLPPEQVQAYLALLDVRLATMASVTRPVERVSVERAYSVHVLMISVQRFLLLLALVALLTELMAAHGVVLDSVIWLICLRVTAEW